MNKKIYEIMAEKSANKIVSWHGCDWCGEEYPLYSGEEAFLKQNDLDMSKLCFDCRLKSLFLWRNERKLFWKKSDKSGKKILSLYDKNYKGKVYDYAEWDEQEGFSEISRDFDENKNIFEEFYKLLEEVPKSGTDIFWENENIWYCNRAGHLKNAYYSFICFGGYNEDIYFSYQLSKSKDIYNSSYIYDSSLVAESIEIYNSYNVFFSDSIKESKNIFFSYSLENCEECIFSSNKIGQKYLIFDKQYEKQEYFETKEEILASMKSYKTLKLMLEKFEQLKKKAVRKALDMTGSEKTVGDEVVRSKQIVYGFGLQGVENAINAHMGYPDGQKNIFSCYGFSWNENIYYCSGLGEGNGVFFSQNVENASKAYYQQRIKACHNVAFCTGIQNQDYSILNKKYSKDEYLQRLEQIKKQKGFGKFLSPEKSPFPINDTIYNTMFPLKNIFFVEEYSGEDVSSIDKQKLKTIENNPDGKGELYVLEPSKYVSKAILDLGGKLKIKTNYRTKQKEVDIPEGIELVEAKDLEDNIENISEDILKKAVVCEQSKRPFRIIKKELDFYKKHKIAISRLHPDLRMDLREKSKPKIGLHMIECSNCQKEILSVYNKKDGYNVYCEECYKEYMYS